MKKIAPTSNDNLPISSKAKFRDSITSVLTSALGVKWGRIVLILFAVIISPIIIFWSQIRFEPSLFVSEWIKISIEGLVLFFILEVLRHRSTAFNSINLLQDFLLLNYSLPAKEITEALNRFLENLTNNELENLNNNLRAALENWTRLKYGISDEALSRLPFPISTIASLYSIREEIDVARCDSIFKALSAVNEITTLHKIEYDELTQRLAQFSNRIETIYGSTPLSS